MGLWPIHYVINIGLVVALCSVIFVVVSFATAAPGKEVVERYTFSKELINLENEGLPWYQDYRFHSVVLLSIIAFTYYKLW